MRGWFVLVAGGALVVYLYARDVRALAEIAWLEQIPVLEHEPET